MGKKTYAKLEEWSQNALNKPLPLTDKRMEYACSNNNVGVLKKMRRICLDTHVNYKRS